MPSYAIEARSFKILGVAGHDFWVLRDEHGTALAELHGLATDRETGTALLVGTDETKHSLRAWHFPHDAAYAATVGVKVTSTSYIDDSQQSNTIAIGDKDEILARWNTAVKAMPELNALDLNYPDYGFKVFGDTVNSNSAFRTFGELMSLPVEDFPGSIEPGLGKRMLSQERIEELRYREQPAQNREPERNPANDPTRQGHPDHTLMQQIRKKIEGLNDSGHLQAADTDRISASVYALAKQNNFSSVDEIALSQQTSAAAAGEKSSFCRALQTILQHCVLTCRLRKRHRPQLSSPSKKCKHCKAVDRHRSARNSNLHTRSRSRKHGNGQLCPLCSLFFAGSSDARQRHKRSIKITLLFSPGALVFRGYRYP